MHKRFLWTCAAVLALGVPLAACDNDQPQTPQEESSAGTQETALNTIALEDTQMQEEVAPPVADTAVEPAPPVLPDVSDIHVEPPLEDIPLDAADEAVLPQDIADENIPPPPNREDFTDESCDYEEWVGQDLNEDTVKAEGRPYRIIKPGDPVTMDFRQDRINVEHEDGKVTRVWCG